MGNYCRARPRRLRAIQAPAECSNPDPAAGPRDRRMLRIFAAQGANRRASLLGAIRTGTAGPAGLSPDGLWRPGSAPRDVAWTGAPVCRPIRHHALAKLCGGELVAEV